MHTSASAIAESRRPHAGTLSQAMLQHSSDERLVSLARSGSERAWAEISRRYGRQLRVYCARFVGPSRAEDAVQQTLLQAFLSLRDGAHREIVLRAWLYRIAHNCSIDLLRKGPADHDQLDLEFDGVAQPPTLFEQREEVRRLVARMRDLPDAQRQALALRELEGRSYEEISAQLGHSGSGVRQLIFRARTTLRKAAAAIMPLGLLKARLSQPVLDCHHVGTAAAVPVSSGGGVDAVGAATLAVVAVLGGGLAASDGASKRTRPAPAARSAGPSTAAPSGQIVAAPAAVPVGTSGTSMRVRSRRSAAPAPAPVAPPPITAAPVATAPALPAPVAPVPDNAVAPAPVAPAPADGDVRQQAVATPSSQVGATTPTAVPTTTSATSPVVSQPQGTTPGAGTGSVPAGARPVPVMTSPSPAPRKPVKGAPVKAPLTPGSVKPPVKGGSPKPPAKAVPSKPPLKAVPTKAPQTQKSQPKGGPAKVPAPRTGARV